MTILLAGNWKMYKTRAEARAFVEILRNKRVDASPNPAQLVLCAPFTCLETLLNAVGDLPIQIGAQTMADKTEGAYTGEVSAPMLQDLGLQWVIVGHSERRQYYGETNETVATKTQLALDHQMTPIVCVGESLQQRDAGDTDRFVTEQVQAVMATGVDARKLVFAYEPIWAIGTGKVCEAEEANRVCALIHQLAPGCRVLYGGSVKPDNAAHLFGQPAIQGGLVGGASLDADSYWALALAAQQTQVNMTMA
jgi:triosephosphate isomerase (TIM)